MTLEEFMKNNSDKCVKVTQKPPAVEFERLPPFKLPSIDNVTHLEKKYGCKFPKSFIDLQTKYGDSIRVPDCFGWATPDIPPFFGVASLDDILNNAYNNHELDVELIPFCIDEGNFYCLDTTKQDKTGECPVVFWDHYEGDVLEVKHYKWGSLACWLNDYFDDKIQFA